MADESSFDIVSKPNLQELENAINMAIKEMTGRFDFRGSKSSITKDAEKITLIGDDDYKLKAVKDILEGKMIKRGVSIKFFEYGKVEDAAEGTKRQIATIKTGIPQEKAKEINKLIKEAGLKVRSQIQGDELRVFGKKKDDLQTIMQMLRAKNLPIELQFVNYR